MLSSPQTTGNIVKVATKTMVELLEQNGQDFITTIQYIQKHSLNLQKDSPYSTDTIRLYPDKSSLRNNEPIYMLLKKSLNIADSKLIVPINFATKNNYEFESILNTEPANISNKEKQEWQQKASPVFVRLKLTPLEMTKLLRQMTTLIATK